MVHLGVIGTGVAVIAVTGVLAGWPTARALTNTMAEGGFGALGVIVSTADDVPGYFQEGKGAATTAPGG